MIDEFLQYMTGLQSGCLSISYEEGEDENLEKQVAFCIDMKFF